MAYCRWSEESELYLAHTGDSIVCMGCPLGDFEPSEHYFYSELLEHLRIHRYYGHRFPSYVYRILKAEQKEYDNIIWNRDKHWLDVMAPGLLDNIIEVLKDQKER